MRGGSGSITPLILNLGVFDLVSVVWDGPTAFQDNLE